MRRPLRFFAVVSAAAAALGGISLVNGGTADADAFTGGNLVVYRVGDGGAALSNAAVPAFVDEFTPSGSKVQSIGLPTTAADGNLPLTATGLSRSEGLISRSADGHSVLLTGYAAAPGTTGPGGLSLTTTDPASVPRVVGILDGRGAVDTSTGLSTASAPKIVRSAVSTDGDRIWAAGGNGGVVGTTLGSTTRTTVAGTATSNLNSLTVQGGQLFASGITTARLARIGTGTPTSAAADSVVTGLPANLLTYGYAFEDLTDKGYAGTALDTLYLANASQRGGTVDKYTYDGATWSLAGSKDVDGAFGLVADVQGGTVSLAVTTPTKLLTLSDTHGGDATFAPDAPTTLATAATGTEFRGVALAPTASAGPSVFVRSPSTGSTVSQSGTGVDVSAYVVGHNLGAVTARLGGGTPVAATKGSGNVWTAKLPVGTTPLGGSTVTVSATDDQGTTAVTRALTVTKYVVPAGSAGPATYAWTNKLVKRSGTWTTYRTSVAPGGKGLTSSTKGSKATTSVYGRGLTLTFAKARNAGKIRVTVDGRSTTVDLYSSSARQLVKSWSFGSTFGKHSVVVTALGTKSAASKGKAVFLSAFQVKA